MNFQQNLVFSAISNVDASKITVPPGANFQLGRDNKYALKMAPENAAQYCYSLSEGGFSDWRLPSMEELFAVRGGVFVQHVQTFGFILSTLLLPSDRTPEWQQSSGGRRLDKAYLFFDVISGRQEYRSAQEVTFAFCVRNPN